MKPRAPGEKPFFGWHEAGVDAPEARLLARLFSPRGDCVIGVYSDSSLAYWLPRTKELTRSRIGARAGEKRPMTIEDWIRAHEALGYRKEEAG